MKSVLMCAAAVWCWAGSAMAEPTALFCSGSTRGYAMAGGALTFEGAWENSGDLPVILDLEAGTIDLTGTSAPLHVGEDRVTAVFSEDVMMEDGANGERIAILDIDRRSGAMDMTMTMSIDNLGTRRVSAYRISGACRTIEGATSF